MFNHVQSYGYDLARATVDGKNLDSTSAYSFAKYHQEKLVLMCPVTSALCVERHLGLAAKQPKETWEHDICDTIHSYKMIVYDSIYMRI